MITHDLQQSSPDWHEHRAKHFNASDAPAMMGLSKYKTRSALLKQFASGVSDEVIDENTQRLFDEGHRAEALARPLAEQIIGEELYPVVASEGKLSASFDGLTMDESIAFEHKSLNDSLRTSFSAGVIPAQYCAQMEQQLMISGAAKCLFMASKWDEDELVEELHCWYESNQKLRDAIMQGWTQFDIDIENYSEGEYIPAPAKAAPTLDLPAVSMNVTGGLRVISNLDLFHEALKRFIGNINMEPNDDQEFANCKDAVKKLKAAEEALDAGEAQSMSQIASIDEMRRMKKLVSETARTTRLAVENIVKERDVLVKRQIVQEGTNAFDAHLQLLNKRLGRVFLFGVEAKFVEAMKSKKTFASMREAVNNELDRVKIESSTQADKIEINLGSLRTLAKDHAFLFNDTPSLVLKDNEGLEAIIKNRISEHNQAEAAKLEAQRAAMQAEEERKATAKAQAEAQALIAAEREKQAADARTQALVELKAKQEADAIAAQQKAIDDAAQRQHEKTLMGEKDVIQPTSETSPQVEQIAGIPTLPDHDNMAALKRAGSLQTVFDQIAEVMHYPDCWDTSAYPTLESAVLEHVQNYFKCSTCGK